MYKGGDYGTNEWRKDIGPFLLLGPLSLLVPTLPPNVHLMVKSQKVATLLEGLTS